MPKKKKKVVKKRSAKTSKAELLKELSISDDERGEIWVLLFRAASKIMDKFEKKHCASDVQQVVAKALAYITASLVSLNVPKDRRISFYKQYMIEFKQMVNDWDIKDEE